MTGGQLAIDDQTLDGGWQLKEPQRVGDGGSAPTDPRGELVMGQSEILDQLLVGACLLEGIEILPVQVFDQGLLDAPDVGRGPDQGGNGRQAGTTGGPPPPLPGNQLVGVLTH